MFAVGCRLGGFDPSVPSLQDPKRERGDQACRKDRPPWNWLLGSDVSRLNARGDRSQAAQVVDHIFGLLRDGVLVRGRVGVHYELPKLPVCRFDHQFRKVDIVVVVIQQDLLTTPDREPPELGGRISFVFFPRAPLSLAFRDAKAAAGVLVGRF